MADVVFEDFTLKVLEAIDDRIDAALEEGAGEFEAAVKRNTRVDTGKTKGSWQHYVDSSTHTAYIGSPDENAIWEEFGTGEYAINGNGRKGGWLYTSEKDGKTYFTRGKKPSRAFMNAYKSRKAAVIRIIQNKLKGQ